MKQSDHQHNWQFVKEYIGIGEEKLYQQLQYDETGKKKIKMWRDCRQKYAKFVCECGKVKEVAI